MSAATLARAADERERTLRFWSAASAAECPLRARMASQGAGVEVEAEKLLACDAKQKSVVVAALKTPLGEYAVAEIRVANTSRIDIELGDEAAAKLLRSAPPFG